MKIKFSIEEYSVMEDKQYYNDPFEENKMFPVLNIGIDSYIEECIADVVFDDMHVYNLQIGRYTSIADGIRLIIDMNHDYRCVAQGRIRGVEYSRPRRIKRKGQIVIMNDCWIGSGATIMGGVTIGNGAVVAAESVVVKDVPSYSIVAGNPAKIIGYRFDELQIDKLNVIRWWNWSHEKIVSLSSEIYGDVDTFVNNYYPTAKMDLNRVNALEYNRIIDSKDDGKVILYIPDFEQDYPTFPRVIDSFVKAYSDSNYELLLYIKNDEFIEEKMAILDELFQKYEKYNCKINIFVGNISDEKSIFCNVDCYVTNRSIDNVYHMDLAFLYGLPVISGVDFPMFPDEQKVEGYIRKNN